MPKRHTSPELTMTVSTALTNAVAASTRATKSTRGWAFRVPAAKAKPRATISAERVTRSVHLCGNDAFSTTGGTTAGVCAYADPLNDDEVNCPIWRAKTVGAAAAYRPHSPLTFCSAQAS